MSRSHTLRNVLRVLHEEGFVFVSQKGSHAKYCHERGGMVIVPLHGKDIPFGTFSSIIRQSGISHERFDR